MNILAMLRKMNLIRLTDIQKEVGLMVDTSQTDIEKSHFSHLDLISLERLQTYIEKDMSIE